MEYLAFPAKFTSSYNTINELGQAHFLPGDNAINFTSDFVPLLPLGTPAMIEWAHSERTLATYEGSVYLSSGKLVRLVDINPTLAAKTRRLLACNIHMEAEISAKGGGFSAEVVYLSEKSITLHSRWAQEANSLLQLSAEIDFLTLRKLPLRCKKQLELRRGEYLLYCHVEKTTTENTVALSAYSARLEKRDLEPF